MKTTLKTLVLTLSLGVFSTASYAAECTAEKALAKQQEFVQKMQQYIANNPEKAQEVSQKAQEMQTKIQSGEQTDGCKAIDEMLAIFEE